jgi:hypothetical protein
MADLPDEVIDRAETLARRARNGVDPAEADAYREDIDDLLAGRDFDWRVREDDDGDVLVVHPAEWVEDGRIRVELIEDTDRAVEVPLDAPGDPDDWDAVEAHNREVARAVREEHGAVHGANADAFADFMSNHYARPVESAGARELQEFLSEYFPRNAWPTAGQKDAVKHSLALVFDAAGEPMPEL